VTEQVSGPGAAPANKRALPVLGGVFTRAIIANGGYDARLANAAIANGEADLIAFGVPYLANPDLPARYLKGTPLNAPDVATFYAGEEKGYADYPALAG
jgi:N-ethylmaleimide reductase